MDIFGGILDDLRGTFETIDEFFDSGVKSTLPNGQKIMSEVGDARLVESGFKSHEPSFFGGFISDAASAAIGGGGSYSSKGDAGASGGLSLREGFVSIDSGEARPTRTTGQASVDMSAVEREWLMRLGKFANLQNFIDVK